MYIYYVLFFIISQDDTGFSDNSTYPNFTKCFRNTVLVWLPCGWLWLTLPVNIYLVRTAKNQRLPVTAFNMSKLVSLKWDFL